MNPGQTNHVEEFLKHSTKLMRAASSWMDIKNREVEIGILEKSEVLTMGCVTLYRYIPLVEKKHNTPLLVIYSQIGRYTMLDLQPDRSLIRNMLMEGFEVYLIDWGHPGRADRWMTFADYVEEVIGGTIERICEESQVGQVSLLGVCEGGVFSVCYAALYPERIKKLALAVTPIDFHAEEDSGDECDHGQISHWVQSMSDETIACMDQLPGDVTGALFLAMTPMKTLTKYNMDALDALSGEREQVLNYFRMEKWLSDRPNHPGAAAQTWLKDLYKENQLIKGEFKLDGKVVDLKALTMPILNVFASRDHIVPPATCKALREHVGGDNYEELEMDVGHIGTFVSRKSNRELSARLSQFLSN